MNYRKLVSITSLVFAFLSYGKLCRANERKTITQDLVRQINDMKRFQEMIDNTRIGDTLAIGHGVWEKISDDRSK
jgi:hypothetical protein